jgi:hypothetical protein
VNTALNQLNGRNDEDFKPDGRSKYAPQVTLRDGMITLAIRQVERKWLPMSLFGRVVVSKVVRMVGASMQEATLLNGAQGLVVVAQHGQAHGRSSQTILGVEWPVDFRQKVFDEINHELHRSAGGAFSVSINGSGAIAIAALALYLIVAAVAGPKAGAQPQAAAESVATPVLSVSEADAMSSSSHAQKAAASGAPLTPQVAAGQAKAFSIRPVPPGGTGIMIWSDPLCPHCRDFEQKVMSKLPSSVGVTVIPVAFKHGARPLVANVLCAADGAAKAKRWMGLMAQQPNVDLAEQCPDGAAEADLNSDLFARAGLQETPSIMKSNGAVYMGDKESLDQLMKWVVQP